MKRVSVAFAQILSNHCDEIMCTLCNWKNVKNGRFDIAVHQIEH